MLKTSVRLPSLARKTASTRKLPLASIRGGFLQVKMEHRWCFHHGGQQQLIPGRHPVTWNLSRLPPEPKPDSCDFQNSGQSPSFLRRPRLPNTA